MIFFGTGLVSFHDPKNIQNEVFSKLVIEQYIVCRNSLSPVPFFSYSNLISVRDILNRIFQRSWISPVVALSFVAVATTGIMMFFRVRGFTINSLHEWAGIAFAVAGLIHLIINWKAFLSCFRKPSGIAALIICTLLCFAFIFTPNTKERSGSGFSRGGCGFGSK